MFSPKVAHAFTCLSYSKPHYISFALIWPPPFSVTGKEVLYVVDLSLDLLVRGQKQWLRVRADRLRVLSVLQHLRVDGTFTPSSGNLYWYLPGSLETGILPRAEDKCRGGSGKGQYRKPTCGGSCLLLSLTWTPPGICLAPPEVVSLLLVEGGGLLIQGEGSTVFPVLKY
jgi:hypothetical protein